MPEPDDSKKTSKTDFNLVGWQLYSTIFSIPVSLGIAAFSYGMYKHAGASPWWAVGAAAFALGAVGGIYETVRIIRGLNKDDSSQGPKP